MTSGLRCRRAERLLGRGFALGELSSREGRTLYGHLRVCASCRVVYDRTLALDEERLDGDRDRSLARRLWEARVVETALLPASAPKKSPWFPRLVVAGAASVALLAVILVWPSRHGQDDELASRQAGIPAFSARAFCETRDLFGAPVTAGLSATPGPHEMGGCPVDGTVRLAYRSERPGHVHLVGRDPDGQLVWLRPGVAGDTPIEVEPSHTLAPVALQLTPAFRAVTPLIELWAARCDTPGCRDEVARRLSAESPDTHAVEISLDLVRIYIGEPPLKDASHDED